MKALCVHLLPATTWSLSRLLSLLSHQHPSQPHWEKQLGLGLMNQRCVSFLRGGAGRWGLGGPPQGYLRTQLGSAVLYSKARDFLFSPREREKHGFCELLLCRLERKQSSDLFLLFWGQEEGAHAADQWVSGSQNWMLCVRMENSGVRAKFEDSPPACFWSGHQKP